MKVASPDKNSGEVMIIHSSDNVYFFSLSIIKSATFLPDSNIPPNIGPILGVPATAEEAMPQT